MVTPVENFMLVRFSFVCFAVSYFLIYQVLLTNIINYCIQKSKQETYLFNQGIQVSINNIVDVVKFLINWWQLQICKTK